MIRRTERLEAFERRYARERGAGSSFTEALAVFEGLWAHALAMRPDFPEDWRLDIEADLTLARVLNGFPAAP
jgi:hypothetical protein